MNDLRFDVFRHLALRHTGMVLGEDKDYFIESRVGSLAEREGVPLEELAEAVRRDADGALGRKAAEALLVGETLFFRDPPVFEALRAHILPALIAARASDRELVIWSAACSTGQEPYSVAMLIREHFPELASWSVRIIASDVSTEALERTQRGLYTHLEVNRGLPALCLVKYFERAGFDWQLAREIRDAVEVRPINLLGAAPALPPVDLVLLRNTLIYFDVETKRRVLERVRRVMRPGARLVLGAAETTIYIDEAFEPADPGPHYVLKETPCT